MAYRVMILEDDPFIALDMENVMEDAGFDIVGPVASVPEALKLINDAPENAPDCALLDFYVTGGTSEFVARELARQGVPFIFLTGNARDVRACMTGHDPLIRSKPVEVERIVEDVHGLLEDA
ncbi:MAG: response regulator [Litorimonas sp.]